MEPSEDDLREIELRVAAATPGPWIAHVEGRDCEWYEACV